MTFQQVPIGAVFDVYNGATPSSNVPHFWNGEIPWICPADLGQLTTRFISFGTRNLTKLGYESCGTSMVPKGSVVLSTRAPIGHLAIASNALCFNQGCRGLVPRSSIDPGFAFYTLTTLRPLLEAEGQGSTFFELSRDKLRAVRIPLPTLKDQKSIAKFLDCETERIDQLIHKKRRMVELLEEKRTVLISLSVITSNLGNNRTSKTRVEPYSSCPRHKGMKIKQACSLHGDYGLNIKADEYIEDGIPLIRTSDFDDFGKLNLSKAKRVPPNAALGKMIRQGDFLISRSGTVGRCTIYTSDFRATFAAYLVRFRPNRKRVEPRFIRWWTQSRHYWDQIHTETIQSTIGNFNASKLSNLVLPPVSIKNQKIIASYLETETTRIDYLKSQTRLTIERLQEYRSALITSVVTGKTEVSNWDKQGGNERQLYRSAEKS